MKDELLAELPEEELAAPDYYPIEHALMWVAYRKKPINSDYAKIICDAPPKYMNTPLLKSAEAKLLTYLRSGKISAKTMNYKKNKEGNYIRTGKYEVLDRETWKGHFNWDDLNLNCPDSKGVWYEYTDILVSTNDLLKCSPIEEKPAPQKEGLTPSKKNEIRPKERDSLLKILLGLALTNYTYDPRSNRNTTAREIFDDLNLQGISVDEDTIRKWLTQAKEYLPDNWDSEA